MKTLKYLAISLLTAIALVGCITNYQYSARGELATAGGGSVSAVIFWHKDEGRLWYGKKYEQTDTDLSLRLCHQGAKPFSLGTENHLVLFAKNGDRRVAKLSGNGSIERLADPEPVSADDACGLILLDGAPTDTTHLATGTRPVVAILCDSTRSGRYPPVGGYRFGAVSRHETDKDRTGPDPCESR